MPAFKRELKEGDYHYVIYLRARNAAGDRIGFLAPLLRSGDLELIKQKRLIRAQGIVFRVGEDVRE